MAYRIAIASSDGESIDLHFAQAYQFYIYDISEEQHSFVGVRESTRLFGHDEKGFDQILALLNDCTAIFVSQIGYRAIRHIASSSSIRIFEAPYSIRDVLTKLVAKKILDQAVAQR